MKKVLLKKVESSHEHLRTSSIEGYTPELPEAGQSFVLYAEPLDKPQKDGWMRRIVTSAVQRVSRGEYENTFTFTTLNSTYTLEVADED